jgi:hypothetical protein
VTRVEFKLTMPDRPSWDGKWSGDKSNYTIEREIDDAAAAQLDGCSWSYSWSDGWRAAVSARIVPAGEQGAKSDGFHGYGWMVDSILRYGKIYADHERPAEVAS